jgi:quercetin 2,3-dioxygenase
MHVRPIRRIAKAHPTLEGAGVHLHRAFGFGATADFDPFLLLDDFRGDHPADYLAGFPWHPHRGIETITYMLTGTVAHGDSLGTKGVIGAGDVQWMTAGSGIVHQEMPRGDASGKMYGFQLWANLPAALKMTDPRYQEVKSPDVPVLTTENGSRIRVVCGTFMGTVGPVDGIAADPGFLDVAVAPGQTEVLPVPAGRRAFAYVFEGSGAFCNAPLPLTVPTEAMGWADTSPPAQAENRILVLFDDGDTVSIKAGNEGIRFLLVFGMPLSEPVAWYGPIVMNTQEELRRAFQELQEGTFLKTRSS